MVVLLLLGLFVAADRVAVGYAEGQVAAQVEEKGGLRSRPQVDITGFPFLSQALAGRYDDVRISLTAAELGQPDGTHADVALHGVQVPLSAVLSGSVQEVPVERIDGTATLSYALLSAQLGADTTLAREGAGLRITRTVELLGRTLPLTAAGKVTLEGNDLVVDVQQAAGAGVDVPDWLLSRAADLLDLRYTVPPLPFGLQVTGVTPAGDGVDLALEARETVLRAANG
ncbi:MAG: hypothetical protein JWQ45_228 [Blastococcus sp.]|nr:hypothetical protein [Blastococcus sp.]